MLATAIRSIKLSLSVFSRWHITPYLHGVAMWIMACGLFIPEGGNLLSTSNMRLAIKGMPSVLVKAPNTISVCPSSSMGFYSLYIHSAANEHEKKNKTDCWLFLFESHMNCIIKWRQTWYVYIFTRMVTFSDNFLCNILLFWWLRFSKANLTYSAFSRKSYREGVCCLAHYSSMLLNTLLYIGENP